MKLLMPLSIIAFIAGISIGLLVMDKPGDSLPSQLNLPGGGEFTLYEGDNAVSLSDYADKVVLLYFGYTSCPDICPTSLAFMSTALKQLDETELKQVQVLFISVDPERDVAEKLSQYVAYFHPNIRGISGTKEQIDKVVKQYGAAYKKVDSESAMGYLVDHSASFFVVNKQGKFVDMLPHGLPAEHISKTIRALL